MKAATMTKATIENIIGRTTDELAVRDINEVFEQDATPATWKLTSITTGHIETATMAKKPVRMTAKQAEAIIEASKVSDDNEKTKTPTTDELETRIEKIKSRMSNMGILDTETETETETSDSSLKLQERKSAHEVYRQARQTFEEYADSDNADYEKTLNLHTAKQDAYKAYQQVAKA